MKQRFTRPSIALGAVVAVAALAAVTLGVHTGTLQAAKPAKLKLDADSLGTRGLPGVKRTPLGDPTLAAVSTLVLIVTCVPPVILHSVTARARRKAGRDAG